MRYTRHIIRFTSVSASRMVACDGGVVVVAVWLTNGRVLRHDAEFTFI